MRVFEVTVNGERLCLAGVPGGGVLSAIMSHVNVKATDKLELDVGGLVSASQEHLRWARTQLQVGDEVRLKVIESDSADEPMERTPTDPVRDLERKKHYVHGAAKELGWTLIEPPDTADASADKVDRAPIQPGGRKKVAHGVSRAGTARNQKSPGTRRKKMPRRLP